MKLPPAFSQKRRGTSPFCGRATLFILLAFALSARADVTVRFPEPSLQVEAGRTKMIAFLRSGNDLAGGQFEASITPADQAEIILPAKILDQQAVGYVRVRALKPGKATLQFGGASLALEIAPETSPKLVVEPQIVNPLAGAAVWGEIAVAADCFVPNGAQTTAVLRLPDGGEIFPQAAAAAEKGPGRHFVFLLDTTRLKPGENDLKVEMLVEGQAPLAAEPVRVRVIAPKPELTIAGECEDAVGTPRTEKDGLKTPEVATDETASGGRFVKNVGRDPVWLTSVEIKEPGAYQMMVVARGDAALGAYPTITMERSDKDKGITNGRVADGVWRRTPIGRPVELEAGAHILGLRFENDFSEGKVDRNLYLDRYELARVEGNPAAPDSASSGEMMAAATMSPMMAETQKAETRATGFTFNFTSLFDGKRVGGPVTLLAKCLLDDPKRTEFPEIGLWVNGAKIATQSGPSLRFTVDPATLHPGKNNFQLRAQDSGGAWIESPMQSLVMEDPVPATSRRVEYFTVFDKAWDASMQGRYEMNDHNRVADSAAWFSDGESVLRLPAALEGKYNLVLLAKGQYFQGLPIAEVALRVKGQENAVLRSEIKTEWNDATLGDLTLPAGEKELVVRFVNDASDGGKGDRNLWLRGLRLTQDTGEASASNVAIQLRYFPKTVGLSDAVVADFFAPNGLTFADLLIDGVPQNLAIDVSSGINPVVLPLLTRSLQEGSHRVTISALDDNGKKTESEVREIFVSSSREPALGDYARAIFLLDRLGFGASTNDLAEILTSGPDRWLADSLAENDGQHNLVSTMVRQRYAGEDQNYNVAKLALYEGVISPNPVRERFVLWAENHFSTWLEKAGREKKRREHEAFARIGVAPFSDLLLTSATSPAMLVYLDQQRSFAGRLNENYAREIMELHTLGVKGGYTQTDVTSLAGLLTGWSMAEQGDLEGTGGDLVGEFRYDPNLNTGAPAQILGLDFPAASVNERYGRVELALETLAAYPSTGAFISRKLAEHYVSDPAPPALVGKLAHVFAQTGGNMRAMLTTLAESPEFLNSPRRVATPLDFSLRVARAVRADDTSFIADFLNRSGMGLFDHASPDGYSQEDASYVSSNALMQRWRFGQKIEWQLLSLVPKTWRAEKKLTEEQTQQMLDLTATRLLGTCLSASSNTAAMELLAKAPATGDARSRLVVNFLCQTSEAGLR